MTNQDRIVCTDACDQKMYLDETDKTCKRCFETCKSCLGSLPRNCLSCELDLYFYKSFCLIECPQMTKAEEVAGAKRCVEIAGSSRGTLKISIIDSTFSGLIEEQNNFFFSGTLFYDGIYEVKLTWNLVAEGLTIEEFKVLQVLAFTRNELRLDRLVVGVNIIDIPNYENLKDKMMVELVAQAGSEYKAEYLPFKMIPRPISIKFEPVTPVSDFSVPLRLSVKFSYGIKDMPVGAIFYLLIGNSRIILATELHFASDIDKTVDLKTPPVSSGIYNLTCSVFGSNTSQLHTSLIVTISQPAGFSKPVLAASYLQSLLQLEQTTVTNLQEMNDFLQLVQNLLLTTRNLNNPNHLCRTDTDCYGNGLCKPGLTDGRYCSCTGGFTGLNCLYTPQQFSIVQGLMSQSFTVLQSEINDRTKSTRFNNVKFLSVMTQLLKFKEFVSLENLKLCIDYLNRLVSNSTLTSISLIPTMTQENSQLMFEAIDEVLNVLSFKVDSPNPDDRFDGHIRLQEKLRRKQTRLAHFGQQAHKIPQSHHRHRQESLVRNDSQPDQQAGNEADLHDEQLSVHFRD